MSNAKYPLTQSMFAEMWRGLGGDDLWLDRVAFEGDGSFDAAFAVSDIASAAMASVGTALAELLEAAGEPTPSIAINRVLASSWFGKEMRTVGWTHEREDSFNGPHPTADDRWIIFHNTYPHHMKLHLEVLGIPDAGEDGKKFADAVKTWKADELESAIRDAGGAAVASHTLDEWAELPQGAAVMAEPVADFINDDLDAGPMNWKPTPGRPLAGLRVLDMTRVIAGPTSTMMLAGAGAEVLRIDSPDFYDPSPHHLLLTLGKRNAILDLKTKDGRDQFLELLAGADVFVHGYRPGALEGLGIGKKVREEVHPGLVETTLSAWGWSSPWTNFRGFDSNIQLGCGIAIEAARRANVEVPKKMPVPVLDCGTGYLMAAATIRGITERFKTGHGRLARCALARTGSLLIRGGNPPVEKVIPLELDGPVDETIHMTQYGPVRRLKHPIEVTGAPVYWDRPDEPLGASQPVWASDRSHSSHH